MHVRLPELHDQLAAAHDDRTPTRPGGRQEPTARLHSPNEADRSQVTYNRRPLYLYIEDKHPGDVKGQGMYAYWYVLSPGGRPITKQ